MGKKINEIGPTGVLARMGCTHSTYHVVSVDSLLISSLKEKWCYAVVLFSVALSFEGK